MVIITQWHKQLSIQIPLNYFPKEKADSCKPERKFCLKLLAKLDICESLYSKFCNSFLEKFLHFRKTLFIKIIWAYIWKQIFQDLQDLGYKPLPWSTTKIISFQKYLTKFLVTSIYIHKIAAEVCNR